MSRRQISDPLALSAYAERAITAGLSEIEAVVLNAIAKFNDHASCAMIGDHIWPRARGSSSCPYARPAGAVVARLVRKGYVQRTRDIDRIRYGRTRKARDLEPE